MHTYAHKFAYVGVQICLRRRTNLCAKACVRMLVLHIFALMKLIEDNMNQIVDLCRKHKVQQLFVFGSILTPRFSAQSDVDLLVRFRKSEVKDVFDNFFDFKFSMEDILGRDVDLLEDEAIRNKYLRRNIDATKFLIYGRA